MKTATDAAAARPLIDDLMRTRLAIIAAADPKDPKTLTAARSAREALIGELNDTASPSFADQYADVLDHRVMPLAQNPNLLARLNAAIVVGKVASKARNGRLLDAAVAFTSDKADAVVLWGLKACKYVMPSAVAFPTLRDRLAKAVLQAVKDHTDAAILEEAYNALTLLAPTENLKGVTPDQVKAVVPYVQSLLEYRAAQYAAAPPENMQAEFPATVFLSTQAWRLESPEQKAKTLQLLYQLASSAGNLMPTGGPDKDQLSSVMKQAAQSLSVIADSLNNDVLRKAAKAVDETTPETSGADVTQRLNDLKAAIDGVNLPKVSTSAVFGESAIPKPAAH